MEPITKEKIAEYVDVEVDEDNIRIPQDNLRIGVQSYGYSSVLLVSYVMWSGALEILDLLLSHLAITLAYHVSIILISTFKH